MPKYVTLSPLSSFSRSALSTRGVSEIQGRTIFQTKARKQTAKGVVALNSKKRSPLPAELYAGHHLCKWVAVSFRRA